MYRETSRDSSSRPRIPSKTVRMEKADSEKRSRLRPSRCLARGFIRRVGSETEIPIFPVRNILIQCSSGSKAKTCRMLMAIPVTSAARISRLNPQLAMKAIFRGANISKQTTATIAK